MPQREDKKNPEVYALAGQGETRILHQLSFSK